MEKISNSLNKKLIANRTINKYLLTTNYEKYLSPELVPEQWKLRHIKLIHLIGITNYEKLCYQASKSSTPQRLMAWLVNEELKTAQREKA